LGGLCLLLLRWRQPLGLERLSSAEPGEADSARLACQVRAPSVGWAVHSIYTDCGSQTARPFGGLRRVMLAAPFQL